MGITANGRQSLWKNPAISWPWEQFKMSHCFSKHQNEENELLWFMYATTRTDARQFFVLSLSHTSQRAQVLQRALGMCCLWSSCLFSSGPDGWSACYLITAHDSGVYSKPLSGVRLKKIDWTLLFVGVLCELYTFRSLVKTYLWISWGTDLWREKFHHRKDLRVSCLSFCPVFDQLADSYESEQGDCGYGSNREHRISVTILNTPTFLKLPNLNQERKMAQQTGCKWLGQRLVRILLSVSVSWWWKYVCICRDHLKISTICNYVLCEHTTRLGIC
jgi:hypothetical protein